MNGPALGIGFLGAPGSDAPHLSVDGMSPVGPNLSHWPGNRTPQRYKRDLSTGICLAFVQDDPERQRAFLGDARLVVNDHYDTDGFLSMLAVTRPDLALPREELLLAAAATGDFGSWQTSRGFAIDRIVAGLAKDRSPVAAEFRGLAGPERDLARYRWLIDHAEQVLDHPETLEAIWREEHDLVGSELSAAYDGGVRHQHLEGAALGVVTSPGPLHRITLNTVAGAWRVLHVMDQPDGRRFRYHDRTESWFEVVTFRPPARRDLRPLAARLQDLEGGGSPFGWHADPPTAPVPELWFGLDEPQAYGQVTRSLGASRLTPEQVANAFAEHLRLT